MELMVLKLKWEVRWSTSHKVRSDKHLSYHLMDLYLRMTKHDDIPTEHLSILQYHIEKLGYRVVSIFASFGCPQIIYLLPNNAGCFMALSLLVVSSKISKCVAQIKLLQEIPIEKPFELVVLGVRDLDQLEKHVVTWTKKMVQCLFINSRSSDLKSDQIIFSLPS